MRVFLAMGPGDIVGDHSRGATGSSGRGETSITFSGQAIRLLRARSHSALLVSSHPRVDSFQEGGIETRNVPKPLAGKGGLAFHVSQLLYAIRLVRLARAFRADLALVDSGTSHWFMLGLFRFAGIPVAVNFHNVRWPHGFEPRRRLARIIRRLDSAFLRQRAVAAMGCSPECAVQARADGADALTYFPWTCQYVSGGFEPDRLPEDDAVFRVLFVGRVEQGKGVFDLLDMARILRERRKAVVRIELCGDGGALEPLRAAIASAGLEQDVIVRGRMERTGLLEAYATSHAVIVPTRGSFCEGMPLVCAEAMLAGRPVITSILSNALPVIGPAVEEALAESVPSYVAAIEKLATDGEAWRARRAATVEMRRQFLDRTLSYAASMDRLLAFVSGAPAAPLDYERLFD